jgi:hypothetical protein
MRPDIEFTINIKKARIKENDAEIERLNETIRNLAVRKEKESKLAAQKSIEQDIAANIEMRNSLVEQNRIDAQIVLTLME